MNGAACTPRLLGPCPREALPERRIQRGRARLPLAGRPGPARARSRRGSRRARRRGASTPRPRQARTSSTRSSCGTGSPTAAARAPLDRVELLMRAAFHAEGPAPGALGCPHPGGHRAGGRRGRPDARGAAPRTARAIQLARPRSLRPPSPRTEEAVRLVPGRATFGDPLAGPVRARPLLRGDRPSGRSRGCCAKRRSRLLGRRARGRSRRRRSCRSADASCCWVMSSWALPPFGAPATSPWSWAMSRRSRAR